MKINFGPLPGILWFVLVIILAVAMFILAAIFVILKVFRKAVSGKNFDFPKLPSFRLAR